jgi:hypothetical protein
MLSIERRGDGLSVRGGSPRRARIALVARTELLPYDLEHERAVGVHSRELCHPGARIEVRVFVDERHKHRVCVA